MIRPEAISAVTDCCIASRLENRGLYPRRWRLFSMETQELRLFLFTAKTGTPVYCPLPPFLIDALNVIPERTAYFFWTGNSTPKTAASVWQESLKRLFLLAGVPIERVSILLGHQSVRITEKHYAPWVRARQEQLEADVRRTWEAPEPQRRVRGGYTQKRRCVIPFKSRRRDGAGGGNRTHGLGIMRPSLYH